MVGAWRPHLYVDIKAKKELASEHVSLFCWERTAHLFHMGQTPQNSQEVYQEKIRVTHWCNQAACDIPSFVCLPAMIIKWAIIVEQVWLKTFIVKVMSLCH